MSRPLRLRLESLEDRRTPAAAMVEDINLSPLVGGGSPQQMTPLGDVVYFTYSSVGHGRELWKTDGTVAGTVMVKDIFPGVGSSIPEELTDVGGTLYFRAYHPLHGRELWKSDGTAAGTVLVKDTRPGTLDGNPNDLIAVGSTLYFSNHDADANTDLWKSDGTEAGTVLVKDLHLGYNLDGSRRLAAIGDTLLFTADDGATGMELWKSDGTTAGTVRVKDIQPGGVGSGSLPNAMTVVGDVLYFRADEDNDGAYELWRSDGTEAGTTLVHNIRADGSDHLTTELVNVGGTLFMWGYDPATGIELWRSDGTPGGTALLKDIRPGTASSAPQALTSFGGKLYFRAQEAAGDSELWTSDGTAAGTVRLKDTFAGVGGGYPVNLTPVGGTLYFAARVPVHSHVLWKSDGTEAGTVPVSNNTLFSGGGSSDSPIPHLAGDVFLSMSMGTSETELWKNDGTAAGFVRLHDSTPGTAHAGPADLVDVGGIVYFTAWEDTGYQRWLWRSDGTPAGTFRVSGAATDPRYLTSVGGTLYFVGRDAAGGSELWKSDGTDAGTVRVKDIRPGANHSYPKNLTAVGDALFFSANDGTTGIEVWRSDGTDAGTVRVKDIRPGSQSGDPADLENVGGSLFFRATDAASGSELWRSDGTDAGTVRVKDTVAGSTGGYPRNLTAMGSTLFFTAHNGSGHVLWKSDGTDGGTVVVHSALTSNNPTKPPQLTVVGSTLYYVADGGASGYELWRSDGTTAGTTLVRDITPGDNTGYYTGPKQLTAVDGTLFFNADDGVAGRELWKSDGTTAGTVLVKDLWAGPGNVRLLPAPGRDGPGSLTNVNGTLHFAAYDGVAGFELWKSDGTEAGTVLVADAFPGSGDAGVQNLRVAGDDLFFSAADLAHGRELWVVAGVAADGPSDMDLSGTTVAENLPATTPVGTLTATGPDTDFTYTLVPGAGSADNARFAILGDQLVTMEPLDFETADELSIRVRVVDGLGRGFEEAFTITVTDANDAPAAADGSLSTDEDTAVGGTLTAGDVDDAVLTFAVVAGPAHGMLTAFDPLTGAYTYSPNDDYHGADSFTFSASDEAATSNVATVSITVGPVNDAPVASDGTLTTDEDVPAGGSLVASDVDDADLTFAIVDGPTHGTLTAFDADTGAFAYAPDFAYDGPDSFTFTATDGSLTSNVATVAVTVTPTNVAPVAQDGTLATDEDTPAGGTLTATDANGHALTYAIIDGPSHGTLTAFDPSTGAYTYEPNPDYAGPDALTFTASDHALTSILATISIAVDPVNDAPVAADGTLSTDEDTPAGGTLAGSDVEGATLTFAVDVGPTHGTLTAFDAATGAYTYAPDPDHVGADAFTFTVFDGSLASTAATVTIAVGATNDAPTLVGDATLPSVPQAATDGPGADVASLFAGIADDADSGDALAGIAVVGNPRDPDQGTWQYSTDGATWSAVGVVSDASALLLSATTRLRFLPEPWFFGPPTPLTVHGVDSSHVGGFPETADVTANGGSTPFSAETAAVRVNVVLGNVSGAWLSGSGKVFVAGTPERDKIAVALKAKGTQLRVKLGKTVLGTFATADVTGRLVIRGFGGDDRIAVAAKVAQEADIFGGDGNDKLTGSNAADRLFGEAGNDKLTGRKGDNLLVGGSGNDVLTGSVDRDVVLGGDGSDKLKGGGGPGEDLLVAGPTIHDAALADLFPLQQIVSDWTTTDPHADRVSALSMTFLNATTVSDDADADVLVGGKGLDWYLSSDGDKLPPKLDDGETSTVID